MRIAAMLLILPLACLGGDTAPRGTKFLVECQNKKCGYTADVLFGGLSAVDFVGPDGGLEAGGDYGPVSGFCASCEGFVRGMVYLGSFPGWKKEDDRYLGQVWDPVMGKRRLLFRCSKCETPVIAILNAQEMAHCPRCAGAATCRRVDEKGEKTPPNKASEPSVAPAPQVQR
jgi:hypothetical protein